MILLTYCLFLNVPDKYASGFGMIKPFYSTLSALGPNSLTRYININ